MNTPTSLTTELAKELHQAGQGITDPRTRYETMAQTAQQSLATRLDNHIEAISALCIRKEHRGAEANPDGTPKRLCLACRKQVRSLRTARVIICPREG